ncbi:acetylcholinesterase [Colletotrichum karsti]|uniref:Acetylcholinesterase n=1 Tax=Colletotrichum karsti TaxID=1095194 RepID=A0A9P6HZX1_9PEZI|nr:acetylcholinesterase [Colletotrichum karsti]KAF9874688.1 acetylcholinesterase [Colletotrichum karsti]
MIKYLLSFGLLALCVVARVENDMPKLTLPWGTWQAARFSEDKNILVFKNVRFGAKPERFGAPSFPDWEDDKIQDSQGGRSCIQINPNKLKNPPGGRHLVYESPDESIVQDEDCLFLDIYVPAKAFDKDRAHLPVVVWLYGGAYAFGSKDQFNPLYTGQSLLEASEYGTIFVTGNYRLGAYGWLAGSYMEENGQPNAGLYDQALLFEWVQEYIEQVRGDRYSVSAWGESAGAGSIIHHLIREDGKKDPNFGTFLVQSPAFEWQWDNSKDGSLDKTFRTFSDLAGCGDKYDIDCLRDAKSDKLVDANQQLFGKVKQTGLFPVGPSVDGKWVKTIPTIAFSQGKYWDNIWSNIVSHCANEAQSFTPHDVDSQEKFNSFLATFFPGDKLSNVRDQIRQQYSCADHHHGNYTTCLKEIIQDSSFTCNTRDLFDSYPDRSYMMEYAYPLRILAYHASDLIPLFSNNVQQVLDLLSKVLKSKILAKLYAKVLEGLVATRYKAYFASFALSGDPNNLEDTARLFWPIADGNQDELTDVLQVRAPGLLHSAFRLTSDDQNSRKRCEFWNNIAKEVMGTEEGGVYDVVDQAVLKKGPSIFEEL